MKKATITICLAIVFFIMFFLQANIFQTFTIAGVMPNIFIIFILFIGLYANSVLGISFGVIGGIIIDLVYSKTVGITAVMLCIIGYLGAWFDRNFSKESKITIIVMVGIATIIYEIGYYAINSMILKFDLEIIYFIKILAIEVLYNVLLVIIFYPLLQKTGYAIDRTFKKNNILTRYF